jgi:hypothetical protein
LESPRPPTPPAGQTTKPVDPAQGTISALWLATAAFLVKRWPFVVGIVGLILFLWVRAWTRQEVLDKVPSYSGKTTAGADYCSTMATALVRYSGYSRTCAWITFFAGVLVGGFAVVIGPGDADVRPEHTPFVRLVTKHRNVVMLLLAALAWTTCYAAFVRIDAAAEAAQLVTKHLADAEMRRSNWKSLLASAADPETEKKRETDREASLDRELFAKCIATRGTWEVARTQSSEFARSVALAQASSMLDKQNAADQASQSAKDGQKTKVGATETIAKAEEVTATLQLKAQSDAGAPDQRDRARKAAEAAQAAAAAAAEVELAATAATNASAGVDPVVAASLRKRVDDVRAQAQIARDAAAQAQAASKATDAPGTDSSVLADTAVKGADTAAAAARQALTLSAQILDTVQATAAVQKGAGATQ